MTHSRTDDQQTPEQVFGELVKEHREAAGFTQQALANRLREVFGVDLSQTALTRLERGTRPIRLNEVHALAHLLNIDLRRFSPLVPSFAQEDYEKAPAQVAAYEADLAVALSDLADTRARIRDEERTAEARVAWLEFQIRQLRRAMEQYEKRSKDEKGRAG